VYWLIRLRKCSGSGVSFFEIRLFLISTETIGAIRCPVEELECFINSDERRPKDRKKDEVPQSSTGLVLVIIRVEDASLKLEIFRTIPCSEF
jgi:hypothetical protein